MTAKFLRAAPCALACIALACGSSPTVTVTPIAAGAQCPNGGVSITVNSGAPQVVCNGTNGTNGNNGSGGTNGSTGATGTTGTNGVDGGNGFTSLIVTTTLPVGDPNCPSGGERIDTGLDDGADGGVAGDGTLQPGESTSTTYVCNGSSTHVGSYTAPGGTPGTSTIKVAGGAADAGTGGNGGEIDLGYSNGSNGGHLKIFKTGQADPQVTIPVKPAVDLGAVPVTISADTTLGLLLSDAGAGAAYLDDNGNLLVLEQPEDGGSAAATGLSIAAGMTLTTQPYSGNNAGFTVSGPCFNSGTITTNGSDGESITSTLSITCSDFYSDLGSQVVNNGPDGVSDDGDVSDGMSSGGISISGGVVVNQGLVQANGGTGGNGGNGGSISIGVNDNYAPAAALFNAGAIEANGGDAQTGVGGSGGGVGLYGGGDVNNKGTIDANGGLGFAASNGPAGGSSGDIVLVAGDATVGSIRNAGALTARGGDVDSSCSPSGEDSDPVITCGGGSSNTDSAIALYVYNGVLVNNAALTATGGFSANDVGGSGGDIYIESYATDCGLNCGPEGVELIPGGDINVSGSIDASGGNSIFSTAGSGGYFDAILDPNTQPNGQEVILLGYASINSSGGSGQSGGNAAGIYLFNAASQLAVTNGGDGEDPSVVYGPGGSIVNEADLLAEGGTATTGTGGNGYTVLLQTQSTYFFSGDNFEQVINSGNISDSGGSGATGGNAYQVSVYGLTGVTSSGNITNVGGQGTAGNGGNGGNSTGNGISIGADNGPVVCSQTIDSSGGNGTSGGGYSGYVQIIGSTSTVSGTVNANGGNGTNGGGGDGQPGANGGSGGNIVVAGLDGTSTTTGATFSATGGTAGAASETGAAGTPGTPGVVALDGWIAQP